MAMKLFYFIPRNMDRLRFWFNLEAALLIINYFLFIWLLIFSWKIRIHVNLKIICGFVIMHYFGCMTARMVLVGYEMGHFTFEGSLGSEMVKCSVLGHPEECPTIVFCSWFRCYVLAIIATILFWVSMERQFAMYYIRDYEKQRRLWIPCLVIVCCFFKDSIGAAIWVFGWIHWCPVAIVGIVFTITGLYLFLHSLRKTQLILEGFIDRRSCPKHQYSLSLKFQIQENLWAGKLMKNGFITLAIINVTTFFAFVPANSVMFQDYFGEDFTQLCDCIYNTMIAANGPTLGIGAIYYSEYLVNLAKTTFCGVGSHVIPVDSTQIYFIQLRNQWDGTSEKDKKKKVPRVQSI